MTGSSISKEIEFDAGHRVPNHESKCRNPHGHRYRVVAHVSGNLVATEGDSQEGMVLDFGFLKQLLTEYVHDVYDHGFIVHSGDMPVLVALGEANDEGVNGVPDFRRVNHENGEENRFGWKVIVVDFIPTAENLAKDIYKTLYRQVRAMTGDRAWLSTVDVWETPTGRASFGNMIR
jgi:6-pyruvoyltetrahydropterin/6-carboxytetrahydropterin synthase